MAEEKAAKGWFRRKKDEGEPESGIQEVVEEGPVKHIHFSGGDGPVGEREFMRVETTTYNPRRNASMEEIHADIDNLGATRTSTYRSSSFRSRTVYSTERGAVTKASQDGQSALYVTSRRGVSERQKRFTSTLVDKVIEDVDLAAPPRTTGPYVHNGYTLHSRSVQLKGGGEQTIYFFSKGKPKSGTPCALPAGYVVGVNERTGLPFLRRERSEGEKEYKPQCSAVTEDGKQCRNSARGDSKYCSSHAGYQPKALATVVDTKPRHDAKDTKAVSEGKGKAGAAVQCTAITADGKQCRNNARDGKTTCASHRNYRAPSKGQVVARIDTKPRWSKAKDTKPTTRNKSRARKKSKR
jgi:hypothetical protein